jgi:hypothetical protein
VLDEVDAPFDEANIGRFVKVLEEFLGLDQIHCGHSFQKDYDCRDDSRMV